MTAVIDRRIARVGLWADIDVYYDAAELAAKNKPYFVYTQGYAALRTPPGGGHVLIDGVWSDADTEPAPADLEFIESLFWLLLEQAKEDQCPA